MIEKIYQVIIYMQEPQPIRDSHNDNQDHSDRIRIDLNCVIDELHRAVRRDVCILNQMSESTRAVALDHRSREAELHFLLRREEYAGPTSGRVTRGRSNGSRATNG